MARFLFATWEGGGHVQPMLLVAQGLAALGHATLALSDACNGPDAAALGVPFAAWRTAPSRPSRDHETDPVQDWRAQSPLEVIGRIVDGVMCGPSDRYAADAGAAIAAFGPDVVVSQELLMGAMAAAEAARVKLAVFASNLWSLPTLDGAPPFGAGAPPAADEGARAFYRRITALSRQAFQAGLPALSEARARLGLPPLDDVFDQLGAAEAILLATSRAFDFDQAPPAPYRYVGPYLADPAWVEPWTSGLADGDRRPLVAVSLSTMYQGQESVLRRVIEALGSLNVRAVVTLGPMLNAADFPAGPSVRVCERAPMSAILPLAAAMVTHAGHASSLRPLMAGVPLVCLPMGRDQFDNAARVKERGAGLTLRADSSAADIAAAIARVLAEQSFSEAARSLGSRIAADFLARSAERALIEIAEGGT